MRLSKAEAALRPLKCCGDAEHQHRRECRKGRPLCRWRRRAAGLCRCSMYHYPHRAKSGACGAGVPAALYKDASYPAAMRETPVEAVLAKVASYPEVRIMVAMPTMKPARAQRSRSVRAEVTPEIAAARSAAALKAWETRRRIAAMAQQVST